jgi:sugar phosphate isomerase/epimerase
MIQKAAVQLFTLREECKTDFPGVLKELKRMGWSGVQFAGYHDYAPGELASIVKELDLKVAGLHLQLPKLLEDTDQLVKEARMFGTHDLICSNTPVEYRSESGFVEFKQILNQLAKQLQRDGIRLSYHNHAFEFETEVEGKSALQYILEPAETNLVLAEIDVYWIKKGGYDPALFIEAYRNRMPIIHLKDMTDDQEQFYAEIGTGTIDFSSILQWGEQSGVEWYVGEQDRCRRSAMDCVELSFTNLTNMMEGIK